MVESGHVLLAAAGEEPTTLATFETEGSLYRLRPEKWIEEPRQVDIKQDGGSVAMSLGNRRGVVADFEPRPLWGLADGRPITVLDARMSVQFGAEFWPSQVYEAGSILWGAHVEGRDTAAAAVRLTFSLPWAGWADDGPVSTDQGHLGPWSFEGRPGLIWEPVRPHTLHELTQRFPPILTALFQLWTDRPVDASTVQVCIEAVGWCPVESASEPSVVRDRSFLGLDKLSLGMVSNWLAKSQALGPIPFIAIDGGGPLQPQAQMLATALEGLHRRLHPHASRFQPPVSRGRLDRARRQARQTAVNALNGIVDNAVATRAYGEALGHVEEPSYTERLAELLPRIERIASGLIGPSLSKWIEDMKHLRNIQSHGLPDHDDFGETEISRYYVMASAGRWVLKILLLLELIEDEEEIRSALRDSDRFMYALANIDREGYWRSFSAYQTFVDEVWVGKT